MTSLRDTFPKQFQVGPRRGILAVESKNSFCLRRRELLAVKAAMSSDGMAIQQSDNLVFDDEMDANGHNVEKKGSKRGANSKKNGVVGLRRLNSSLAKRKPSSQSITNILVSDIIRMLKLVGDESEFKSCIKRIVDKVDSSSSHDWFFVLEGVYMRYSDRSKGTSPFMKTMKSHDIVLALFRQIQTEPWYKPFPELYSKVISLLGWSRKPDLAWELLLELQSINSDLPSTVCNAAVRSLLLSSMTDEAVELLCRMTASENCKPNLRTYNIFIESKCMLGKPEEAAVFLRKIQEMGREGDDFTYTAILDGYCRKGDNEAVHTVLNAVINKKFIIKSSVMIQMIHHFGRVNDWDGLKIAWKLCMVPGNKATQRVFSTFMWAYSRGDKMEELLEAKREHDARGFTMHVGSYASLFTGLSKSHDPMAYTDQILSLWEEFRSRSFPQNAQLTRAFAFAMTALYRAGMYDLMSEAFYHSLEVGCPPTTITCSTFVRGFAHGGFIEEMELAFEMLRQVSTMNCYVQEDMVAAYETAGDSIKAELLKRSSNWFSSPENTEEAFSDSDDALVED